jgi:hypothetical protein
MVNDDPRRYLDLVLNMKLYPRALERSLDSTFKHSHVLFCACKKVSQIHGNQSNRKGKRIEAYWYY